MSLLARRLFPVLCFCSFLPFTGPVPSGRTWGWGPTTNLTLTSLLGWKSACTVQHHPPTTSAASYCICSYLGLNCAELCLSVSCPWFWLFNLRDEQSLKPDSYHRWPDSRVIARNEPHRIHHYAIPFTGGINSQKTIRHDFSDSHIRDIPFADPV